MKKAENFIKTFLKKEIPDVQPGDEVKVFQKIKEKDKEKIQVFEGVIIAKKHGKEIGATITVRKVIGGVGVERIFPLHLPTIEKIEITRRSKIRRAKLYYLREAKGKKARLKRKEFVEVVVEEKPKEKVEKTPQQKEKDKNEKKSEV